MALLSFISRKVYPTAALRRNFKVVFRLASSEKKEDQEYHNYQAIYKKIPDFSKPLENKNWISFGSNKEDIKEDRYHVFVTGFICISLFIFVTGFLMTYTPDKGRRDWAKREAFIRLHEREQLGLELIDPNYVDPATVVLPPDEELSDEDIVI